MADEFTDDDRAEQALSVLRVAVNWGATGYELNREMIDEAYETLKRYILSNAGQRADDDALSLQFGSRYLADREEISHLRHRLETEHDAWNHEAERLQIERDRMEQARDLWAVTATWHKDEAQRVRAELDRIVAAVLAIEVAADRRDQAIDEFGVDDDKTFTRDLADGAAVSVAISMARAYVAAHPTRENK